MKTLLLVRHAKSSWQEASLSDHDRPLNARGMRDAPRMGEYLARHYPAPEIIFSSTALRATTTAAIIADTFGASDRLVTRRQLYTFAARELLAFLRSVDNRYGYIMLAGHNPAITDLVNQLSAADIENVPTCGAAVLTVSYNDWSALDSSGAVLEAFVTPKTI